MRQGLCSLIIAAGLLAAGATSAEPQGGPQPPAVDQPGAADALGPKPLDEGEMDAISGGDAVQVQVMTRQQLTGTATGNSVTADQITTGAVNFSPEALSGFNGIGNFVINTGANNTLQGAINISVVTTPTP